jgi:DNA-directed RNA polymerase subunit E'/Rpb7
MVFYLVNIFKNRCQSIRLESESPLEIAPTAVEWTSISPLQFDKMRAYNITGILRNRFEKSILGKVSSFIAIESMGEGYYRIVSKDGKSFFPLCYKFSDWG